MPPYLFYNDRMDWKLFTGERAGTDALLLADFAKDAHGTYGADLGCGSGVLLLLLLPGGEGRRMTGVDIRESAAASARENLRAFALEERGDAGRADYRSAPRSAPRARPFRSSAPPRRSISTPAGSSFLSTAGSASGRSLRRCVRLISRRCAAGTFSPRRESARPSSLSRP